MQKNYGNTTAVAEPVYRKKVLWLIFAFSILRLLVAFNVELANDESYYWLYSQHLKWNYFDHPPMIALAIRLFTLDLSLQNYPGFIRLGSVVCGAASTWFMYKCVAQLYTERAGWFAACLYTASFYSGITAGILTMPDTPQMVFWTLSLWLIVKLMFDDAKLLRWILFGVTTGLCIMSKVHGVFLWTGVGLYTLFYKRSWLAKPGLYVALLITVIICLPILFWNLNYHFATYSFNSKRVDVIGNSINWHRYFFQVTQEIGLNNPFNILLIVIAFIGWQKHHLNKIAALKVYNFIGLPFALILLYIPLFRNNILPHWSGPAYVTLMPLAAINIDKARTKFSPVLLGVSVTNYVVYLLVCTLLILYYPGTFGSTLKPRVGTNDLTIDFYGWKQGGEQFDSLYTADVTNKVVPANTPVICYKWWGAHVEYYFCRPLNIKMIGLGDMMDIHEYMWMNERRKNEVNLDNAYCIVSSDEYFNPKMVYKDYYAQITFEKEINVSRGNKPAHDFYIYQLHGWKGKLPVMK